MPREDSFQLECLADRAGMISSELGLPRAFFVDPDIFAADVDRVFLRHWFYAGHVASVERPGDFFLYDLAEESYIVVRDEGGEVRVFANVCGHRGSRVCIEEYGRATTLTCPYHGWTYGMDGSRQSTGNAPPVSHDGAVRLQSLHVRVVDGLIFACAAPGPPPFDKVEQDIRRVFLYHDLAGTRIAYHRRYLCPANWKLVQEHFLGLYETAPACDEFARVFLIGEARRGKEAAASAYEKLAANWRSARKKAGLDVDHVDLLPDSTHSAQCIPIRSGYQTTSPDGKPLAPLLGTLSDYDGGFRSMHVLSSWIFVANDHAVALRLTPIDPKVTEMDITWLVRESAVEGKDYRAEALSWLWKSVVERALKICSDQQLGVQSRAYTPGPATQADTRPTTFRRWYLQQLTPP